MSFHTGINFFQLAEQHSEAVACVRALRQSRVMEAHNDIEDSLENAVAKEKVFRAALIEWKPKSINEAQLKLLYLAQYLFTTTSSFSDEEMAVLLTSIAHLRK